MTLSELRTMVNSFVTDLYYDNYVGTSPTSAQVTSQINWAIRAFSEYTWCNYDHKITLTLSSSSDVFDLRDITTPVVSRKVLYPHTVTISGKMLYGPDGRQGLWSLADLLAFHPNYQSYTAEVPRRAIWLPNNKLLLSAPPDAATAALNTHYVAGVYLAADLVDSTDDDNSPDIPEECHEMLAFYAAQRAIMPSVTESEGWQKVAAYRTDWMQAADRMRSENRQTILGPSSIRGSDNDWMLDTLWV